MGVVESRRTSYFGCRVLRNKIAATKVKRLYNPHSHIPLLFGTNFLRSLLRFQATVCSLITHEPLSCKKCRLYGAVIHGAV